MRSTALSNWVTRYSVLYFMCFFIQGLLIGSLGPSIPLKAKQSDKLSTDFSIVFTFLGYGVVIGCAVVTKVQKLIGSHKTMSLGLIIISLISFSNYSESGIMWNAIQWMIIGICHNLVVIEAQVELMAIHKEGLNAWLQALHFGYGVGASITPLLLSIFGTKIIIVYSLMLLVLCVLIFRQKQPKHMIQMFNEKESEIKSQQVDPETLNKLCKLVGLFLLIYVGAEINYGGWISTYTSFSGVTTQNTAGLTASIFWIFITAGRLLAIPMAVKYPAYQYLKFLIFFGISTTLLCLILMILGFKFFIVFVGSAMYGFACSAIYPLGLSLPIAFGYPLSSQNTARISLIAVIGLVFIPFICGYSMKFFGYNMLYIVTFALTALLYFLYLKIMEFKPENTNPQYLKNRLIESPEGKDI